MSRLVGGAEAHNRPALHLRAVAENQEGYLSHRSFPQRREGRKPHTGLPSLEYWS